MRKYCRVTISLVSYDQLHPKLNDFLYCRVTISLVSYDTHRRYLICCIWIAGSPYLWWVTTLLFLIGACNLKIAGSPYLWWVTTFNIWLSLSLSIAGSPYLWWVTTYLTWSWGGSSCIAGSPYLWWVTTEDHHSDHVFYCRVTISLVSYGFKLCSSIFLLLQYQYILVVYFM